MATPGAKYPLSSQDGLFCSINERGNVPDCARDLRKGSTDRERQQIRLQKRRHRIKGYAGKRPSLTLERLPCDQRISYQFPFTHRTPLWPKTNRRLKTTMGSRAEKSVHQKDVSEPFIMAKYRRFYQSVMRPRRTPRLTASVRLEAPSLVVIDEI